jgi:hypothetical protein
MRGGKTQGFCVLGLASLLVLGCTHPRAWIYLPHAAVDQAPRTTRAVIIPPFVDERSAKNSNRVLCYVVPLCPYGWQDLEQPERATSHIHSGVWRFDPAHDLAQALADEISHARLFGSVVTKEEQEGQRDFILRGTLVSTRYEATLVSYGLSVLGPNLWLLGLPLGSMRETLAFRLRLEDQRSGQVSLQQTYRTQQDDGWVSLYTLPDDFSYDRMFQTLVPTILKDIERALKDALLAFAGE